MENLSYLEPLLPIASPQIDIATLNYDLSIEKLAAARGMSLDTGIERWQGGHEWNWDEDAQVRLLKLHGSIDWTMSEGTGDGGMEQWTVQAGELPDGSRTYGSKPGLVFGARGKVRATGPFLAMLREFDEMLSRADRVVVVGYSFRDDHINVALSRWLNSEPLRPFTVVDPNFLSEAQSYAYGGQAWGYPKRLWSALSSYQGRNHLAKKLVDLSVIPRYAKDGIALAFGDLQPYRVKASDSFE